MKRHPRARLVDGLLKSAEPAIRWRTLVNVLGEDPKSARARKLRSEIRDSGRVRALLARQGSEGTLVAKKNVYDKWQGAHWVLMALADIGYPAGDPALNPIRDQVQDCWLADFYFREFEAKDGAQSYRLEGVPVMNGRHRRCAAQQGAALLNLMKLGLADDRTGRLAERLLHWQWPDGGWNCDRDPAADTSSFMETLLPMRGLHAWASATGDIRSREAAVRAAEVFLSRRLYRRRRDGSPIDPEFLRLHYPLYWHYDILAGLKGLAELGLLKDPRCADALDLLEQKELPTGGWPAERAYYRTASRIELNGDYVDWGGAARKKANEWVTTDALFALRVADRAE